MLGDASFVEMSAPPPRRHDLRSNTRKLAESSQITPKESSLDEKPFRSKKRPKIGAKRGNGAKDDTPAREDRKVYFQFETDILLEILLRVTTESILECRYVCKTWYNMIRSPTFINMQMNISRKQPTRFVCQFNSNPLGFKHVSYPRSIEDELLLWDIKEDTVWKMPLKGDFIRERQVKYSYNGLLLCIAKDIRRRESHLVICNPLTTEFIKLPLINSVKKSSSSQVGVCFVPARQEHIIVQLLSSTVNVRDGFFSEVVTSFYILTSGQRKWRLLTHPTCIHHDEFLGDTIYWKNAFHWAITKGYERFGSECILSFDTVHETFQVISFPPDSTLGGDLNLVVLNDRLTLTVRGANKMKVWEVTGDRVGKFTLVGRETYDEIDHDFNPFSVLAVASNDTKQLKKIEIDGHPFSYEMTYYYPTHVSVHSLGFLDGDCS